jgi:hypothetical protein
LILTLFTLEAVKMSRIRLVPVILIALASLLVLFGAYRAYEHFSLITPLQSELRHISGVQNVVIEQGKPGVISIKLKPVDDLQTTYQNIVQAIRSVLGDPQSLNLIDNRSPELKAAYESFQPILQEGIAKGDYTEMITSVNEKAAQLHIQARITMDSHYVYVQLAKGNYYLYDVIPYTVRQGGASS